MRSSPPPIPLIQSVVFAVAWAGCKGDWVFRASGKTVAAQQANLSPQYINSKLASSGIRSVVIFRMVSEYVCLIHLQCTDVTLVREDD